MVIKQHLYSSEGTRRYKKIELTTDRLTKQDGVLLPHSKHTNVIWLNNKGYPIIFRTAELRDIAFTYINDAIETYQEEITLPLSLFYKDQLTEDKIKTEIQKRNYTFKKHIRACAEYVMNHQKIQFAELHQLEAFRNFSKSQMKYIKEGKQFEINNEQLQLFSETLRYPKEFHSYISPLSFWRNLYELCTIASGNGGTANF